MPFLSPLAKWTVRPKAMQWVIMQLGKFLQFIGTAGETPSLANLLSGINNTPDPREGEGVGL